MLSFEYVHLQPFSFANNLTSEDREKEYIPFKCFFIWKYLLLSNVKQMAFHSPPSNMLWSISSRKLLFDSKALSRFHLPCCYFVKLLKGMIYTWCHVSWQPCFYCCNMTKYTTKLPFWKIQCFYSAVIFFPISVNYVNEIPSSWESLPQFLSYHPILIFFLSWLWFCYFFLCTFRLA